MDAGNDAGYIPEAVAVRWRPARSGMLLAALGALAMILSAPVPSARAATAAATPAVTLSPTSGQTGVSTTASGTGFACTNVRTTSVNLTWDKDQSLGSASVSSGGFSLTFQTPAGAAAGSHTVTAACSTISASATFTVVQPTPSPTLALKPAAGPAGSALTASGTGYNACASASVVLSWDKSTIGKAQVADDGSISASLTVPQSAGQGDHTVTSSCNGGTSVLARSAFTVQAATATQSTTPGSTTTPTTNQPTPGTTVSPTPGTTLPGATPSGIPSASAAPAASASDTASTAAGATGRTGAAGGTGRDDGTAGGRSGQDNGGQDSGGSKLRSGYARALPTPGQLFHRPGRVGATAGLALLLLPLVGFAAELFHKTVHHNRRTLRRWFGWAAPFPASAGRLPRPLLVPAFFLLSAALAVLVEPGVGANAATVALVLGFLVAIPLGVVLYNKSIDVYEQRASGGASGELEVLPGAAIVAIGCALLSWGAAFNPGYVYGLIAEYRAKGGRTLTRRAEGRAVLIGALVMLAAALTAWVARSPVVSALAHRGSGPGSFALAVTENVLCQVVVGAVVAAPIVLLPIHYMDGRKLWEWSRPAWAAASAVALVLFTVLVLDPSGLLGAGSAQVWLRAVWLFGGFAVFSLLFWAFFHVAPARLLNKTDPEAAPDSADTMPLDLRRRAVPGTVAPARISRS